ncbi:hypothetical protein AGOR_G00211970 [Albula goreensis]|uniref:C2H2-type domain-containing protein n=1 Tax=Albula goreensis TaxID=1534307 RepID=A0A8T3CRP7_9TELE|nr:hypothetical protein AGOR_G00211970 [Albula goreensis]
MPADVLTDRGGAVGGMDVGPALYMCFRCYQVFDSLDDVLFHQYNLHPNDVGAEDSLMLPPGPQTESDEAFQCVPCWALFSTREELLQHQQSDSCSQRNPVPGRTAQAQSAAGPQPSPSASHQQDRIWTGAEQNGSETRPGGPCDPRGQEQNAVSVVTSMPGQPTCGNRNQGKAAVVPGSASQIQYQCGDCASLFESLGPWLQHRKLGDCRRTEPEPQIEGQGPETEAEKGPTEAGGVEQQAIEESSAAIANEPITDSQNGQGREEEEGVANPDETPKKTGGKRKRLGEAASQEVRARSFLCGECGAGFSWQPALVAHRRTDHGLEEALHQCLECGENFMNTSLFVLHCKKHRDLAAKKPRAKRRNGQGQNTWGTQQQTVENGGGEKTIIRRRPTKRKLKLRKATATELGQDGLPVGRKPRRRRGTPQECPQCGRSFSNPRYLRAHVLSHSGQKQFRCEICGKGFTYQNNLRRHHLLHTGARPYMCDRCGKTFTQSSHLKDHLRNHDRIYGWSRLRGRGTGREQGSADVGPKLAHPCPDCPRSFMTHTQLLMHRKMCPICERSFKWRGSLPAHIVRHTDNKLFSCEVCGKTFSYQTNLARHLIIHAGTRPYSCHYCGKTFNQSSNLRQHLLVHAKAGARRQTSEPEGGDPTSHLLHTCPECPSSFRTFNQLQKHRRSHGRQDALLCPTCGLEACGCQQREDTGSAPLPDNESTSLSCPKCSAQFESQSTLDDHAQSCRGESGLGRGRGQATRRGRKRKSSRQAECELCGHCCVSQEDLDLHQLSHAGQAQLRCPLSPCERRFTTSSALQNHLFSHFPGPTCQNLRPENLLDPTLEGIAAPVSPMATEPRVEEVTETETTVAVIPLWEVFPSDPAPAGP